jgi:hypothetical protein
VKETVPENVVMIPTGRFVVKDSDVLVLLGPDKALAGLKAFKLVTYLNVTRHSGNTRITKTLSDPNNAELAVPITSNLNLTFRFY